MNTEPEQIRQDIEETQRNLSDDVDALTDKVSPSQIVQRRVDRARGVMNEAKDKVMGTFSSVGEKGSSAASSVADAVSDAPGMVQRRTQGNPLAVGLIAFGAGWLVSSLLPASEAEKRIATRIKDQTMEHSDVIKEEVTGAAQEIKDNLREPTQEAMQTVTSTASEAANAVREEGTQAAKEVKDQVQTH